MVSFATPREANKISPFEVVHEALLKRCDVLGRESNLLRDGTQLHGVFWIAFGRRRRLWKVVAKGGHYAEAAMYLRLNGVLPPTAKK